MQIKDKEFSPIRSGKGKFFFWKGNIIFNFSKSKFNKIKNDEFKNIENFIPLTLKLKIERTENYYLNKALAKGIFNHYLETKDNSIYNKLINGHFGKISLNQGFEFKTSLGSKEIKSGFQFEVDLVLENETEIIIIEAKQSNERKKIDEFSLLQLYYPYKFFKENITEKKIKCIFFHTENKENKEIYQLIEFKFENDCFDKYKTLNFKEYELN